MPCCPPPLLVVGPRLRSFLRDYDALQSLALALIYLQIGCSLIGSLGALFNAVLVINLVIGLFAVVAIESSSQRLGRTYAVLLFFAVVLDVAWFILFSHAIWTITPDEKCIVRRSSMADDILGGSIYDPSYYSSLFEDVRNNACNHQGDKQSGSNDSGSTSAGQSPRLKSFACRSLLANDVESGLRRPLNS
ncbi:unnamed protein product [Urochloa humidicola]